MNVPCHPLSLVSEMRSLVLHRTSPFPAKPITSVSCPCHPAARKHVWANLDIAVFRVPTPPQSQVNTGKYYCV